MTNHDFKALVNRNAGLVAILIGWGFAFLGAFAQEPEELTAFPTAMYMIACCFMGFAVGWFFKEDRAQK